MDSALKEPARLPHAPRRGDVFEGRISMLNTALEGQFRLEALVGPQETPRVFIATAPGALPGELIRAEVISRRGDAVSLGEPTILEPSPERIIPACAHLTSTEHPPCGGCRLQHVKLEAQRVWKQQLVESLLTQAGAGDAIIHPTGGLSEPWYYRNRMELTFTPAHGETHLKLGLYPTGWRNETFQLWDCRLLSPPFGKFVEGIAGWARELKIPAFRARSGSGFLRNLVVRESKNTPHRLVELVTSADALVELPNGESSAQQLADSFAEHATKIAESLEWPLTHIYWTVHDAARGRATTRTSHLLSGDGAFRERLEIPGLPTLDFEIAPAAFFQTNTKQAERLYLQVLEAAGIGGGGEPIDLALDLYCGTGTIALALSFAAKRVIGIELNEAAVEDAKRNAAFNDRDNLQFYAGDAGAVIADPQLAPILQNADVVVVDPPRAGLMPKALEHISALAAPRLVYVSCNPASLARDTPLLAAAGYKLKEAWPIDMFPHTAHIETVARFEREQA